MKHEGGRYTHTLKRSYSRGDGGGKPKNPGCWLVVDKAEGKKVPLIQTLIVDPPWPFGDPLPGSGRGAVKHYPLIPLPVLKRYLPIAEASNRFDTNVDLTIADPDDVGDGPSFLSRNQMWVPIRKFRWERKHGTPPPRIRLAEDCRIFLWRVGAMQEEAIDVIRAWGFKIKAEFVWEKLTKTSAGPDAPACATCGEFCSDCATQAFGMGRTVRYNHEVCLIGVRGKPKVLDHSVRSHFKAPVGKHSTKPEEFYRRVERLSPGPYLELFARNPRPGWYSHGMQLVGEKK